MQTHSMTPAKITNPSAAQNPPGILIVPGVKPLKALKNDAAATSKTTVAIIGPMIAKTTEYIILLKIAWSPTVSAIFFTAKSIKNESYNQQDNPNVGRKPKQQGKYPA